MNNEQQQNEQERRLRKVLVIIDAQNDFCHKNGALSNERCTAVGDKLAEYIRREGRRYDRVIMTRDTHYQNYLNTKEGAKLPVPHCLFNTWGVNFREDIFSAVTETFSMNQISIIEKPTFMSLNWGNSDLSNESIDICGFATDICVINNALILNALSPYPVSVISNLCAGTTPEHERSALEIMQVNQIEVVAATEPAIEK